MIGHMPHAGAVVKEGLGTTELEVRAETSASALAAYAQAQVQARFVMAERRPRNMERARTYLLKECDRLGFAEVAVYQKPVGDDVVEGPSIRMAEACMRAMGNVDTEITVVSDDQDKRILLIKVTDLETNFTVTDTAVIQKVVERRNGTGREILYERTNSKGKQVFGVRAMDDEIVDKQAAVVSKKLRSAGLRLVPGDIVEAMVDACKKTQEVDAIKDLPAVRRRTIAGFESLKPPVTAEMLSAYLGKDVTKASAAEVVELKRIGVAIRDGDTTWEEVRERRAPELAAPPSDVQAPPPSGPAPQQASADPGAPDPVDVFIAELQQVDEKGLQEMRKRVDQVAPKGHHRREDVARAINDAATRTKGKV